MHVQKINFGTTNAAIRSNSSHQVVFTAVNGSVIKPVAENNKKPAIISKFILNLLSALKEGFIESYKGLAKANTNIP